MKYSNKWTMRRKYSTGEQATVLMMMVELDGGNVVHDWSSLIFHPIRVFRRNIAKNIGTSNRWVCTLVAVVANNIFCGSFKELLTSFNKSPAKGGASYVE